MTARPAKLILLLKKQDLGKTMVWTGARSMAPRSDGGWFCRGLKI